MGFGNYWGWKDKLREGKGGVFVEVRFHGGI